LKRVQSKWIWSVGLMIVVIIAAIWVWPTGVLSSENVDNNKSIQLSVLDNHINVDEAFQMRENGTLMLDVRTQEEWDAGHIPGATLIPLDQLNARYGELPTDQEIVIYCRSGNRSAQALDILTAAGISNTYTMDGGINDWITKGYEIVVGE
jgi:rhodanese-related sulfurtransferase